MALLLPAVFCACSDSDSDDVSADVLIPGNYKNMEFGAEGGEQNVAIQSNLDLVLTPSADWVSVEPLSSTSQTVRRFKVVCQPCSTGEERSCQINVQTTGFSDILAVKQLAGKVVSAVSDSNIEVAGDGGSFTVTVKANDVPVFSPEVPWLSVVGDVRDNDDGTYSADVKAAKNFANARDGVLVVSNGSSSVSFTIKQGKGSSSEISGMPDEADLVATYMGMGWNLGNSLDAHANEVANETCWGNGACTQATMDAIRAAGFRTVRIPVTWLGHIGSAPDYKIDDAWMNRVAEVVGYAENAGLNAIINIHPALLPRHGGKGMYGPHVHEAVWKARDKETGMTVHWVTEQCDGGPIIAQKAVEVREGDTPEVLHKRVMEEAEWKILPQAINLIANDKIEIVNNLVRMK